MPSREKIVNALDRMVQLIGETKLDAGAGDHRADLANSLPDYPGQLWVRVGTGDTRKSSLVGGIALRHQSCGQLDLHANSVWDAQPAPCLGGYSDRLDHDPLDDGRRLAALSLGGSGANSLFGVGVVGNGSATVDHGDELGEAELIVSPILYVCRRICQSFASAATSRDVGRQPANITWSSI